MLAPWKKSYDQPRQHSKKHRCSLADKGPSSQSYGSASSHVWMWEWTVKTAEHWRIDTSEPWSWRRLLRVPWTTRRSNQSILKEISPGCSLKGLILKLKLQYFGHLMQRTDSLEKTLMLGKKDLDAGKDWRQEEKGTTEDGTVGCHHQLYEHEFEQALGFGDGKQSLVCYSPWGYKEWDTTEQLN